jgi:flagellar M-ring protein FliF
MFPLFNQLSTHIKSLLNRFPPERKTAVITSFGLMVVATVGLVFWALRPQYKALFNELTLEDSGEIVQLLQKEHIPYKVDQEGRRLLVPSDKLYETRMKLAAAELPRDKSTGWEIFDQNSLGVTDFVQKLNFRRALEGELSRTILQLEPVEAVRVHLVIPEESLFKENQKNANASVNLRLKRGQKLSQAQVEGIAYLVSSAVEGLSPENVTVIDSRGFILTEKVENDPLMRLTGSQLELQQKVESSLLTKGQTLLDKRFGPGRSSIQVTASLNFNQKETQSDIYDADNPAIRSEEITSSTSTGADTSASSTENSVTNYEINLTCEKEIKSVGNIDRLSIAVMVDGKYTTVENPATKEKTREFAPLPANELDDVSRTIQAALGYNSTRGDEISVVSVPFSGSELYDEADLMVNNRWENYFRYGQKFLIFGAIIMLLLMVKSFLKRATAQALQLAPIGQQPQLQGATATASVALPPPPPIEEELDETVRERKQRQEQISSFVEEKPEVAARLVRSWLVDE